MFTRGFWFQGLVRSGTTLINFHPGVVNTKLLKAGWGPQGIDVEKATDTYELATREKFGSPGDFPKYYAGLEAVEPDILARNEI